ncbi:MAG: hypothetical protein UT17_C0004G0240 [Candidatus Woesebacteria bacterium GW2011_GWB1_39_10]|uniref:Uncharacterized protein n=2 Tax=Candidatus Woeseibacteriota TaxID=1752722 RepID=A0A0G0LLH5_9BACT|nr:MAG: hypothetical protein UT17_C0004G0240 [Candidatus Woesebacteria bacterium GW2011_GWB1_39_10]KKS90882.1 MAG: hypothetical protein UV66_C0001G0239 [Candidatus Woesebacteria bacterium GW2011_GWA1_43_12]
MENQNQVAVETPKISKSWPLIAGALATVVVGVAAAWLLFFKVMNNNSSSVAAPGSKVTDTEAGRLDPKIQYTDAVGTLVSGGIGNEGTHHLDRDGGVSQTVYLTSSVIDLESFVGKKVRIWGETLASKKAGWLMDISKIQVQ